MATTPYPTFAAPVQEAPQNPFSAAGLQFPTQAPAQPMGAPPQLNIDGMGAPLTPNPNEEVELDLDALIEPMIQQGSAKPFSYDITAFEEVLTPSEMAQYGLVNPKETPLGGELSLLSEKDRGARIAKAQLPAEIMKVESFKDFDDIKPNIKLSEEEVLAPFSAKDKPFMAMIAGRESALGRARVHAMIDNGGMHDGARAISSFGVMPASALDLAKRLAKNDKVVEMFPEIKEMSEMNPTKSYGRSRKTFEDSDQLKVAKMIGSNPALDAYLAKSIFLSKKAAAKRSGISSPDEQDLFALVGYYAGEGAARKIYKKSGVEGLENHPYIQDLRSDLNKFKFQERYKGFDVPGVTRSLVKKPVE